MAAKQRGKAKRPPAFDLTALDLELDFDLDDFELVSSDDASAGAALPGGSRILTPRIDPASVSQRVDFRRAEP